MIGIRRLGRSPVEVTRLGFGGAPLGNLFEAVDDDLAVKAVLTAFRAGMKFFDTAPLYGFGMSEHRCGEALRRAPRDQYVLSTKVGRLLRPDRNATNSNDGYVAALPFSVSFDYSYDGAMRSFEDSLQRLGTDRVDILLIHDIDRKTHDREQPSRFDEAMTGAYRALEKLRSEKVVGAIGLGVNESDVCIAAAERGDFDCFLVAGRYSLLDQSAVVSLLPLCVEREISIIIGGVFNSGILVTGDTPGATYDYKLAPNQVRQRVRRIEQVCHRHGIPLAAAALQFPLGHRCIASVIPGARTPQEVEENLHWAAFTVPAAFWDELKAEDLIHRDVPVPMEQPFHAEPASQI